MDIEFSKNKLQSLGRRLRDSETPLIEDIALLQKYRISYKESVKNVFDIVCREAQNINSEAICSFRIKRIDSIIRKLQRLKGYIELKSMRDIAGCRCIMQSDSEVFKLMKALKRTSLILAQEPNIYIGKNKKASGYQSIHMYVSLPEYPKQYVEIQIRSIIHHDWATFVETIDLLYNGKIKEGVLGSLNQEQYDDLFKFHQILAIPENQRKREDDEFIIQTVTKYDIIGRLDEILVKNIVYVRHQWADMSSRSNNPSYFYISTNTENKPTISAFTAYSQAEDFYYKSFESNSNANMVLVCMPNASFDMISIAYSNYILISHKFTHQLHLTFAKYIENHYAQNPILALRFSEYYKKNAVKVSRYISVEIDDMQKSITEYNSAIINEWYTDVKERLGIFQTDLTLLTKATLKQVAIGDTTGIKRMYKIIMYYLRLFLNHDMFTELL